MARSFWLAITFLAFASAFSAEAAPSKLECAMSLAHARNALATLGRLEKSLDAAAALAIAAEDIRVTMPPLPVCFDGRDALLPRVERALGPDRDGDWRLLPTSANRMPAAVSYLRRPGDSLFRPFKVDVLRVENGRIAEIWNHRDDLGLMEQLGAPVYAGARPEA